MQRRGERVKERDLPAQIKRMHRLYAVTPRRTCGECHQCVGCGGHWRCELFREETRLAAAWQPDWSACGMLEEKR